MILEFKVFQPQKEKTLEDTVERALKQIEEKRYADVLTAKGLETTLIDMIQEYVDNPSGSLVEVRCDKSCYVLSGIPYLIDYTIIIPGGV